MDKSFGLALRKARKEAHFTQQELAQKCGISHMSIRRYETGERFPSTEVFYEISSVLPYDYLSAAWVDQYTGHIKNKESFEYVTDILTIGTDVSRHECIHAIEKADSTLLTVCHNIIFSLLKMNEEGQWKVSEIAEMIGKVPEYKKEVNE